MNFFSLVLFQADGVFAFGGFSMCEAEIHAAYLPTLLRHQRQIHFRGRF